jgi:hypothetical protein
LALTNALSTVVVIPYVAHSGISSSDGVHVGRTAGDRDHSIDIRTHRLTFLGEIKRDGAGGKLRLKLVDLKNVTLKFSCSGHTTAKLSKAADKVANCGKQSNHTFGDYPQIMMHSEMCLIIEGDTLYGARFRQKFTLEDAIGSHACSLEANTRVTNGIPLGSSLLLPVCTVHCVQTPKV